MWKMVYFVLLMKNMVYLIETWNFGFKMIFCKTIFAADSNILFFYQARSKLKVRSTLFLTKHDENFKGSRHF